LPSQVIASPPTDWPFLEQHQADDRCTEYREHLYTLNLGNAACANTTVACQIYVV